MQQISVMNRGSNSSNGLIHELFNGGSKQRRFLLPVIAFLVMIALCLPVLLVYESNEGGKKMQQRSKEARRAIIRSGNKQHLHALLFPADTNAVTVRGDVSAAAAAIVGEEGGTHSGEKYDYMTNNNNMDPLATLLGPREATATPPLPPYTFANVLHTLPRYHDNIAILIYDPASDKFIIHYSTQMRWVSGCQKLITSLQMLSNSLRLLFPTRFDPNNNNDGMMQDELALSVSSGDFPSLRWNDCLRAQRTDCKAHNYNGSNTEDEDLPLLSPILHFGSVFQVSLVPTTTYAMPMPQYNHLHCFHYWTMHQQICEYYLPKSKSNSNGLVFGKSLKLNYDNLIPQVVWRGTDFSYLSKLMPQLRRPNFESDILSVNKLLQLQQQPNADEEEQRIYTPARNAAIESMRGIYNELIPRWKGVVWTAEAERDAQQINNGVTRKANTVQIAKERQRMKKEGYVLPWCNIKFASAMYKGKNTPALDVQDYTQFNMYGIPAAGESMDLETLATYKYHIDIGGGGGTTWSGTLEKLALPGVLFHHVTPTKDYFHDLLVPYVHYIPIKDDLSDLREKYVWAESHPQQAKEIANAGTALVQSFGTVEGFMALYSRFYEDPLRQVVEAYVPLRQQQQQQQQQLQQQQEEEEEKKKNGQELVVDWQTAMVQLSEEQLRPIMQCGGYYHHDCERLVDDLKHMKLG